MKNKSFESKPEIKFEWMYKRNYGVKIAGFFIEWATLLDNAGQLDEAIKTAELGLSQASLRQNIILKEFHKELLFKKSPHLVKNLQENNQESDRVLVKKFAFKDQYVYPSSGGEFSFEELKAQVYYRVQEAIQPSFEKEKSKYLELIDDLKTK